MGQKAAIMGRILNLQFGGFFLVNIGILLTETNKNDALGEESWKFSLLEGM